MALHRRSAGPAPPPEPIREFEVTIVTDSEEHRRPWLAIVASALVAIVLVAVAVPAVLTDPGHHAPVVRHARPGPVTTATSETLYEPGLDAIAFAFRGPLRCVKFTFATSDASYARALPGHGGDCVNVAPHQVTVFHQVRHEWRLVLSSADYACPVASLPETVQVELRVCPAPSGTPFSGPVVYGSAW
jgi:hypothetical protein